MKLVKKLMESIREYKTASILTPVYVTVEVIMEVLIPFVMASLIDKGIEAGSMSVIWKYGIILLVLAMIALADGKYRNPSDHGRDKCTECISDAHPRCSPCTDYDDLRNDHVIHY